MRIVVTGGSGLVGRALQDFALDTDDETQWHFLSSMDGDLTCEADVVDIMDKYRPTHIVHLAANVGGLFKNMLQRAAMFEDNLLMNTLVLREARRVGVKRIVCMLSTCIFPDSVASAAENLVIDRLHDGPPHPSNEGYAYAKRMMEVHARILSEQYGIETVCMVPTNVYGPYDNFDIADGHVLPSLIHRAWLSKESGEPFVVAGSGRPLRQFIYNHDLARMIWHILSEPMTTKRMICAPPPSHEVSIGYVAGLIAKHMDCEHLLEFDTTREDGQYKKTVEPDARFANFDFTDLEKGLKATVEWFIEAHKDGRARV